MPVSVWSPHLPLRLRRVYWVVGLGFVVRQLGIFTPLPSHAADPNGHDFTQGGWVGPMMGACAEQMYARQLLSIWCFFSASSSTEALLPSLK